MIIQFLTGIGILLFGVNTLSSAFEKICGNKIRYQIAKYNKSKTKNTLFGILLVLVMQSSTASISLIMGLGGLGILTLFQSFCIIIGTNIASAINTFWVAFQGINIVAYFGLLTLIGVFVRIFGKSNTAKNWGTALCGFGLVFIGLSLMSSAFKDLSTTQAFLDFFFKIDKPMVLFVLGLLLSALLNSSLGTTAILSSILISNPELMSLQNAAYVIYAMNIGTCLTLILIGLTSNNRQSLKVSLSYLIFNIIGALIFCPLTILDWITPLTSFLNNPTLQLIFVNIIFNVVTAFVCLPLAKPITKLLDLIIKDKKQKHVEEISQTLTLGLVQLNSNAISYFYETCDNLEYAMNYVLQDKENIDSFKQEINQLIDKTKDMNIQLLQFGGELSQGDENTKRDLNNTYIGLEKTNVNILKLINSCSYNGKKVNFTQKQNKIITSIQELMLENLQEMRFVVYEFLTKSELASKDQLNKILDNLEQILNLKIKAKKSIILDTVSMEAKVKKYTCYLNVINYFEQINTNLTDIVLNLSNFKIPENLEEKMLTE